MSSPRRAEFFSFGTNDLTQTTFGISRDDAAPFLETYRQKGIIEQDPFVIARHRRRRRTGAAWRPRRAGRRRPDIKLGICGEHGGDPASIRFCEEVGLDYVSCSPFRVPIARLAAAQAAISARVAERFTRGRKPIALHVLGAEASPGNLAYSAARASMLHLVRVERAVILDRRSSRHRALIGPHHVVGRFARRRWRSSRTRRP